MKITFRLWAAISALIVVVLLIVWTFLIILLPGVYFNEASARLEREAEALRSILAAEFPDSLSQDARSALERRGASGGLRIELRDLAGRPLYRNGGDDAWQPLADREFELVAQGHGLDKTAYRPGYGDVLVTARRIDTLSGAQAVLTVCMPAAPIDDTLGILAQQMTVVIPVSLAIAMLIAYCLSRMFLKPIREMDALAASISQGEYGKQIAVRDRSELGDLMRTINAMSARLGQTERSRQSFIEMVSHQFKTPLAVIQGHVELVADTLPPELSEGYRAQFSAVLGEIRKLDGMARDMLTLSSLRQVSPEMLRVELDALCAGIVEKLSVLDGENRISTDVGEALSVCADPALLRHLLENLLKNALRHSRADSIRLTAHAAQGGRVRVSVSDNGVGLKPDQLARVWDRFYKGDPNSTEDSGLGMSIVREILEAHGAEYGIRSEGGLEVWFYMRRA